MRTFTVNGTEYKAKPFDFNLVCDLEDMGISLSNMAGRNTSFIRAYFGLCAGIDKEKAGKEIEKHFIEHGELNEISEALNKEMEKSDFFQSLIKRAETEDAADQDPESEKAKEK